MFGPVTAEIHSPARPDVHGKKIIDSNGLGYFDLILCVGLDLMAGRISAFSAFGDDLFSMSDPPTRRQGY